MSAECPFDVASTVGSTVTVLTVLVRAVVAKVFCAWLSAIIGSAGFMKTSAKPGEGTGIRQTLAVWSQLTVETFKVPLNRPSTWNLPPKYYSAIMKKEELAGGG